MKKVNSSRNHKDAVKEVVSAVCLLGGRKGATVGDVYFVMENYDGRTKRQMVQRALKTAVAQGLLSYNRRRYKIRTAMSPELRSPRVRVGPDPRFSSVFSNKQPKYRKNAPRRRNARSVTNTYQSSDLNCLSKITSTCTCQFGVSSSEKSLTTDLSSCSSACAPQRKAIRKRTGRYRYSVPKKTVKLEQGVAQEQNPEQAQVDVCAHLDQGETKSTGQADEEIKAAIRRTMEIETVAEDETANRTNTEASNPTEESKTSPQQAENATTSDECRGADPSSCQLATRGSSSENAYDGVKYIDLEAQDSRLFLSQPSCSNFGVTSVPQAFESKSLEKSVVQNLNCVYQTRSKTKNQNKPSLFNQDQNRITDVQLKKSIENCCKSVSSSIISKCSKCLNFNLKL